MAFTVVRSSRSLVRPSAKTPTCTLELSIIDKLPVVKWKTRSLHVFKYGPDAAKIIREALSKALVLYYPLAGRLGLSSDGQLQVECCEQGVWFVEAYADCSLEAVHYFDDFDSVPHGSLIPDCVDDSTGMESVVAMQVTQFGCGGFVIGLVACHRLADGAGAAQFLRAVGELARGMEHPSVTPVWCRDLYSSLPFHQAISNTLSTPPPPPTPYKLENANVEISLDQINKLKKGFQDSTGKICSTFDVVAAIFWRCRTSALKLKQNTEVKLYFFGNCRQYLDPPLPEGYYGNFFFPMTVSMSSESLVQASTNCVIKLIQEAKIQLPTEFGKFLQGYHSEKGEDPFAPPLTYTSAYISEWSKLGFYQVDYGWGSPVHVVPILGSSFRPVGILGSLPPPKKGIRLMTWCVEQTHRQDLIDEMTKVAYVPNLSSSHAPISN